MMNLLLILTISLSFIAGHIQNDLLNPSFPDIMEHFSTIPKVFHLSSSSGLIGMAFAGIIWGPLSDSFGRKTILLSGFIILLIGLIGIVYFTQSIEQLIFWRFIQGIGIAAPITICVALIFDFFDKKKASQLVSFNNGIITTSKSFAPILGGYINFYCGWQFNFYVLIILVFTTLVLNIVFLEEPISKNQKVKFNFKYLIKNYFTLLSSFLFMQYCFILGFMACTLSVYLTSIPIIFINHLGVDKLSYGFYQSLIMATFAIISFMNTLIIEYFGLTKTKNIGLSFIYIGSLLLIYSISFSANIILSMTISMMLCSAGFAMLIAITMSDAINIHPELKGYSTSLIAFIRLTLTATAVAVAGLFFNGTMLPLVLIMIILIIGVIILSSIVKHKQHLIKQ